MAASSKVQSRDRAYERLERKLKSSSKLESTTLSPRLAKEDGKRSFCRHRQQESSTEPHTWGLHCARLKNVSFTRVLNGNKRVRGCATTQLPPYRCQYVDHGEGSHACCRQFPCILQLHTMLFLRGWWRTFLWRHALNYAYLIVIAAAVTSFAWLPTVSSAGAEATSEVQQSASNAPLFAELLCHDDGATFVATRVKAELEAGTAVSDILPVAVEAAEQMSWGECSRLCNGGVQTADADLARKFAVDGLRSALSERNEWSDSYVDMVGERIANAALAGDSSKGQMKTRSCNTFPCPFEVPTELKAANLQIAREPEVVAAFGVIPQVDFTEECKGRLKLDEIDQRVWAERRTEQLQYQEIQERAGALPGWEATVLSPEHLSLYSCISLCRLHHRCSAVIYSEDIGALTAGENESSASCSDTDAVATLQCALANGRSLLNRLEESIWGISKPRAGSDPLPPQNRNPVCSLYARVKVSRVAECATQPTTKEGMGKLTLLVVDLGMDFANAARGMRSTMALQVVRYRDAIRTASSILERALSGSVVVSNIQQRAKESLSRVQKARKRASVAIHVLSEAVRVVEEAALHASGVLKSLQPDEHAAAQMSGAGAEGSGSSVRMTGSLQGTLHSAAPLSTSCPMFPGVELLNRGCVQLPALQTRTSTKDQFSSDSVPATTHQISEEVIPMNWQMCQVLLNDVNRLLKQYRDVISQLKKTDADAAGAEKQAKKLLSRILGLNNEETARLSSADVSDPVGEGAGAMSREDAAFLEQTYTRKSREEIVERLGEGEGSIFAVFNTAKQICEIRAVFEPRFTQNGETLGAQFPSACASFSPFSLMFLPYDGDSSAVNNINRQDAEKASSDTGRCPDISCTYSSWTSWSPCDDAHYAGAETIGGSGEPGEPESQSSVLVRQATWQVRVKEALLRPKATLRCANFLETRLCRGKAIAETGSTGLMGDFANAVSKSISNWCEYSPYSLWSDCTPHCIPRDNPEAVAYQISSRTVHQYTVPGLAARCDLGSLEARKVCSKVPVCPHDEGDAEGADGANGGSEAELDTMTSSAAAIRAHSFARAPVNGEPPESWMFSRIRTVGPQNVKAPEISRGTSSEKQAQESSQSFMESVDSTHEYSVGAVAEEQLPEESDSPLSEQRMQDSTAGEEADTSASIHPELLKPEDKVTADQSVPHNNSFIPPADSSPPFEHSDGAQPTIPYDSPFAESTEILPENSGGSDLATRAEAAVGNTTEPGQQASQSDEEEPEEEPRRCFLGLSCLSFVLCCLLGALSCTTIVLLTVVCSSKVRSWLGYHWSGATDEERKALLQKAADSQGVSVIAPLINPDGVKVLTPEGSPLLVFPCKEDSGAQYLTADGSKVFVTMNGDFVNDWGVILKVNELPKGLREKASVAISKDYHPSVPAAVSVKARESAPSGLAKSAPKSSLAVPLTQAKSKAQELPKVSSVSPKDLQPLPLPKQAPAGPDITLAPITDPRKPGMPSRKPSSIL
ncbi:hypothetical protein, conserved [Eimeria necatrix]|uniref:Uncharacterized protein n=1 Tax=Eimeria necatrix TaxID=51315 RepID=U6MIB6_9EIME|nr:hypothetical protein, conserved [Eimeria necatrix]CDJ62808.1 hypothetical protein, conserved [Eimeria necatrix]